MKKYVLPTLVSLTLSSSWVLADETTAAEPSATTPPTAEAPPAAPPDATQQHDSLMERYQELRKKQTAYMQEMQALREKLHQAAKDPEEWQRLRDEMQRLRDEMRQEMQQMREKMRQEGRMMPGGPYNRGPNRGQNGRFGPRWGGPNYGPGPYNRPYRGGPGWMPGGPNYGDMPYRGGMPDMPGPDYGMPYDRGGMPDMPRPDFNMPYDERGGMPSDPSKGPGSFGFDKNRPLGHHAKMEQSLKNIEKLLEQVVELLEDEE